MLNEIPPQLHPNCLFLKVCFSTATSHCPNMPLISHFSFITAVFLHQELHKTRFGRWKNLLIAVQNFSLCFISACSRQVWQPCVLSMCSSLRPELRERGREGKRERGREEPPCPGRRVISGEMSLRACGHGVKEEGEESEEEESRNNMDGKIASGPEIRK